MTTPTPSLRRRVVGPGVVIVALVLLAVNAAVYLALRASLHGSLDDLLSDRARAVQAEQRLRPSASAQELAATLQARGLRAVVTAPDGTAFQADPSSPVLGTDVPPPVGGDAAQQSRAVVLDHGLRATVFARTAGVSATLRRLVGLQVAGSLLALAVAAYLLTAASRRALRPIAEIAAAASRTAAGQRGERLHPDRPDTELGRMAVAYDEMLDALEAGMQVAAGLERRRATFETRWRQVLEAGQEGYLAFAGDGRVVDLNPRTEALFGRPRAELLGSAVTDLVVEGDRAGLAEVAATLAADPSVLPSHPLELEGLTRSGATFPAELLVWGVDRRGGEVVHGFISDVGGRRQAQAALSQLAAIIEGSDDAVMSMSPDGTLLTWNPAAQRIYGWTAEEAVGRHVSLIVPEGRGDEVEELVSEIVAGSSVRRFETERLTKGGTLVEVALTVSPVRAADGQLVAISAIARDLTEHRWMAGTLDATLTSLEEALDQARAAEERTRQFLADAAHQLRTPMAGIQACAETLLRGVEGEDADRLLATMVRETSRSARLVTGLLQMARLDGGTVLVVGQHDVVISCRAEVERARLLSPALTIGLDEGAGPTTGLADGHALQEVLANLMDNARRHAVTRIDVRIEAAGSRLCIAVADDGPGVGPGDAERVFERFVSLDGRGGSGLGLPIARGLARAMGGDLRYDRGFVLTLPRGD